MTKSRPPFFTKALSFTGSSTRRPVTSGAISMKFARTLASSVRGLRSVSRITSSRARAEPTTTPIPILRPHCLRSNRSATGSICPSSTEDDQPQQARKKDDSAWIKKRERTNFCLQAIAKKKVADHERKNHADGQADHPRRKKGADNVDCRRAPAAGQERASGRNEAQSYRCHLHL